MAAPRRQPSSADARTGAATVELALCLPLFLAITPGICEIGQALKVEAILSQAARQGGATAARPGCSNADVTTDVHAVLTANKIPTDSVTITVLVNGQAGSTLTAKRNDKITVTVAIPMSQVNWTKTSTYLRNGATLSQTIHMVRQG